MGPYRGRANYKEVAGMVRLIVFLSLDKRHEDGVI